MSFICYVPPSLCRLSKKVCTLQRNTPPLNVPTHIIRQEILTILLGWILSSRVFLRLLGFPYTGAITIAASIGSVATLPYFCPL